MPADRGEKEPMAVILDRAQRHLRRLIEGQVTGGSANHTAGLVIDAMHDYQAALSGRNQQEDQTA